MSTTTASTTTTSTASTGRTRTRSRLIVLAVAVPLIVVGGAMNAAAQVDPAVSRAVEAAAERVDAVTTAALGDARPGDTATVSGLPDEFPLAQQMTAQLGLRDGDSILTEVAVPGSASAVEYWTQALPAAGYQVQQARTTWTGTVLVFTGHGCTTGSEIKVSGAHAVIDCE